MNVCPHCRKDTETRVGAIGAYGWCTKCEVMVGPIERPAKIDSKNDMNPRLGKLNHHIMIPIPADPKALPLIKEKDMSNPHTPGPWVLDIEDEDDSDNISIRMASSIKDPGCYKSIHIFEFDGYLDGLDDDEAKEAHANLHLMAKAPELLNAIHEALALLEGKVDDDRIEDTRMAVINTLRNGMKYES